MRSPASCAPPLPVDVLLGGVEEARTTVSGEMVVVVVVFVVVEVVLVAEAVDQLAFEYVELLIRT